MIKLRFYSIFYHFLLLMFFLTLYKFGYDFYKSNKSIDKKLEIVNIDDVDKIIKPRLQIERTANDFDYMESDYLKFLEGDDMMLKNVDMRTNFGFMKSGRLDIKNDKDYLIFTENPEFTIYVDNVKK